MRELASNFSAIPFRQNGASKLRAKPLSFVEIPPGTFTFGGSQLDRFVTRTELPAKEVEVTQRIAMGQAPVTVGEWLEFRSLRQYDANQSRMPVVGVSWHDANDYAAWLSEKTGSLCRLPTEVEWEYSARGGGSSLFPHGLNTISEEDANYLYDERGVEVGKGELMEPACYPPNCFGLFDMSGNVCEWTASPWSKDLSDCSVPQAGKRAIRGGAWDQLPRTLRCSWRDWAMEESRWDNLGFRVVIELGGNDECSFV